MTDQPRLSPAEIQRRLIEMEKEKDKTRPHITQRRSPTGDLKDVILVREKKNHRVTVVISASDKYRMLQRMPATDNPSAWIRRLILAELDK